MASRASRGNQSPQLGRRDRTPVEEFFRLLDDYRRGAASKPAPSTAKARFPSIEYRARRAAVLQRRLICLVHSNDPDIRFDAVGAMPVLWNSDEWLDADRRGSAADPRHE
ncbi:hypothetical protein [Streptomyces sp. WM6368]|uniref:hypothetical protein n=1 Tax=Streptomyces sp. WM6368 TaxID=1415554 RepID=UPI000AC6E4B4|nr:hypothetical protein [Streptomyces sp. WM6368]